MSEYAYDGAKSRQAVMSMRLKDVLNEFKDSLDLANRCGDICATVKFANDINTVEEIISGFMTVDEETEGLISEAYEETDDEEPYSEDASFEQLRNYKNFKNLFIRVSDLKMSADRQGLKELAEELNHPSYSQKFGTEAIVYLRDMIFSERALPFNRKTK